MQTGAANSCLAFSVAPILHLFAWMLCDALLTNKHTKHVKIITWSQTDYPSLVKRSTACSHQTRPKQGTLRPFIHIGLDWIGKHTATIHLISLMHTGGVSRSAISGATSIRGDFFGWHGKSIDTVNEKVYYNKQHFNKCLYLESSITHVADNISSFSRKCLCGC